MISSLLLSICCQVNHDANLNLSVKAPIVAFVASESKRTSLVSEGMRNQDGFSLDPKWLDGNDYVVLAADDFTIVVDNSVYGIKHTLSRSMVLQSILELINGNDDGSVRVMKFDKLPLPVREHVMGSASPSQLESLSNYQGLNITIEPIYDCEFRTSNGNINIPIAQSDMISQLNMEMLNLDPIKRNEPLEKPEVYSVTESNPLGRGFIVLPIGGSDAKESAHLVNNATEVLAEYVVRTEENAEALGRQLGRLFPDVTSQADSMQSMLRAGDTEKLPFAAQSKINAVLKSQLGKDVNVQGGRVSGIQIAIIIRIPMQSKSEGSPPQYTILSIPLTER